MDMATVCARLAALASTISGVTATGYVPDYVSVPHFFTAEYDVNFDRAMARGVDEVELTCRVLCTRADDLTGQTTMHGFLGTLKTTLETGRRTGAGGTALPATPGGAGACDDFHVQRVQAMRMYVHGGQEYYGADIVIKIIG